MKTYTALGHTHATVPHEDIDWETKLYKSLNSKYMEKNTPCTVAFQDAIIKSTF
jgi:hypothetical protein